MLASRFLVLGLVAALSPAAALAATQSKDGYPSRPVRMIVPFAPGGASDTVGRIIQPAMADLMKQQVVVDNRGGAAGNIGVEVAARANPDGYNFLPYFKGEAKKGPRQEIMYFSADGDLNAVRWNDWKINFAGIEGNIAFGSRKVTSWPLIVNLRADPYEKMPFESMMYLRWYADNLWAFAPAQEYIKKFLATIPQYPFQQGSSLNAAGINYNSLKAMDAMKRLQELETMTLDR